MLETERLRLIPLDLQNLLLLKKDRASMERNLGLEISKMSFDPQIQEEMAEAIDFWITRVGENEENYFWFTNWEMVLKDKNMSIGGIGLTGLPDRKGEVTVGYGVDGNYHRQGFATEALQAMVQWIFKNAYVHKIVAETLKDNLASHKVLLKNGFVQAAEKDLLYIWRLERSLYFLNYIKEMSHNL
ncbi:GNAT family N-acetyltransferase [Rhodocytophaga rosea]|uniref:GNAT family N-acetyltransferase n=1 Tax=Rhodocytophaga rosea TaxID=2704465 RepID=A0A6C0GND4_9BACT|nr:GNAT family N-acetyltransferase [Rhodocytophaga rosea]QHT69546.1 GNAT family N-acetyltransferase [Rhodocytophaga rosea]